jgi:hypothetical protein
VLACCCSIAVLSIGCSGEQSPLPASQSGAAAADLEPSEGNLSGLWSGTTTTGGYLGMPGKIRSIQLRLKQVGDKITGSYRCYSGKAANSLCRNGDETGSVTGTAHGNQISLNVFLLPDQSNCRYSGILDYNGNGPYTCYSQGGIVEQGNWQATGPVALQPARP